LATLDDSALLAAMPDVLDRMFDYVEAKLQALPE